MKKNIKYILYVLTVLIIITIILYLIFNKKENNCDNFDLEELFFEINLATSNSFKIEEGQDISKNIPITLPKETDYLFSLDSDDENEFFLVIRNLDSDKILELENFVETNNDLYKDNKIKFVKDDIYTYLISSKEHASTIEGIIRSYIYCN